jgi:hypothetical protein
VGNKATNWATIDRKNSDDLLCGVCVTTMDLNELVSLSVEPSEILETESDLEQGTTLVGAVNTRCHTIKHAHSFNALSSPDLVSSLFAWESAVKVNCRFVLWQLNTKQFVWG